MTVATVEPTAPPVIETFADVVQRLGDIPLDRILARPYPGTATEQDVIECEAKTAFPGLSLSIRRWFERAGNRTQA